MKQCIPKLNINLLYFTKEILDLEDQEDNKMTKKEFFKKIEEDRVKKHYWDELILGYTPNLTQTKRDFDIGIPPDSLFSFVFCCCFFENFQ